MQAIIEKELKEEILTDEYEYFFSFLTDRFEYATLLWEKELEKKFNKKFKPIFILSAKQNQFYSKENYIVINQKLKELKEKSSKNNLIYLQDYEDLNKEFSESALIKNLIDSLIAKQGRVFILGFTSSNINLNNPNVMILGPNSKIVDNFDSKIKQIKLFHFLDLPRNKSKIYRNFSEIKSNEKYPFYISATYTSGGHESGPIFSEEDLDIFYSKLRSINKKSQFFVADLIKDIKLSPNVNAIISGKDDTRIICITDQLLRGNQYLGNIYPSKAEQREKEIIINTTKKIGNYLSNLGFRGLFGLDFIINSKGEVFVVDLNPRRQGGYICNILMSKKINIPEVELKLALGEGVPKFSYEDFSINYCWAHSKIKPYDRNVKINNEFKIGEVINPFLNIGGEFSTIFYPKNSLLLDGNGGYLILTGNTLDEVKSRIIKESEISILKNFEIYGGMR